jgi:glutamate-1-semialdehyde 2,1-aminomutase
MLDAIDAEPGLYDTLEQRGARLEDGLRRAAEAADVAVSVQRVGSMFTVFFSATAVRSWDDAAHVDRAAFGRFFRAMLAAGVLLPPSAFEAAFLSLAHDEAVVDTIITAAESAFREARP